MDSSQGLDQAVWSLGAQLARILALLETRMPQGEDVVDFDQTYVVTVPAGAAGVVTVGVIPRTLRYVEIEFTGVVPVAAAAADDYMALFTGNNTLAQCQAGLNTANAAGSNATCVTPGGRVKCREYLDQSGYMTVYMLNGGIANVRIRSLDILNRSKQGANDVAMIESNDVG